MNKDAAERVLDQIRRLEPQLRARAAEIDDGYRLPADIVEALKSAGVFRLFVPESFGGLELDFPDILQVVRELSRIDGSIGWIAMFGGWAMFATLLPRDAYARVYGGGSDTIVAGSIQNLGVIRAEADGWRVSGRWPFASACLHADWLLGFGLLADPAGEAAGENPKVRLVLLPAARWRIEETWRVLGLKGTGSHHITLDGRVSLESEVFELGQAQRWAEGPLYAAPIQMIQLLHGANALGIAEGALADVVAMAASDRREPGQASPRDSELFLAELGEAQADIRAARARLFEQAENHWRHAQAGTLATNPLLVEANQTGVWVVGACRRAVERCFSLGGGAAVYDLSPLQRRMRDIQAAAQHGLMLPRNYIKGGKLLLAA